MTNYTFVNYKNTKSLIPKEIRLAEEHLSETEPLFMTEHLVDNDGKLYRRYRLRTCDPPRFVETLDYDIECPRCHNQLRLCGMAVDAMTHGLYRYFIGNTRKAGRRYSCLSTVRKSRYTAEQP